MRVFPSVQSPAGALARNTLRSILVHTLRTSSIELRRGRSGDITKEKCVPPGPLSSSSLVRCKKHLQKLILIGIDSAASAADVA